VLSEQEFVDCNFSFDMNNEQVNHGCAGGMPDVAFTWAKSNNVVPGKYYTYVAGQRGSFNETTGYVQPCKRRVLQAPNMSYFKVTDVHNIYNEGGRASAEVENEIMQLLQNGPVTAGIYAGDDLMSYSGGVYSSRKCHYMPNHAVTIVGYGTDRNSGKKYWKVKNSWDAWWGDNGYIYVERGVNMCNIEMFLTQPSLTVSA